MNITVNPEEIKNIRLFIATPMYGGQCFGGYTSSMIKLSNILSTRGVVCRHHFLYNESLITRARNYCADEFLRSDCTHLLFIDSDISFDPKDVYLMLALIEGQKEINDGKPLDILCGPYPKKNISWEKIKSAVDKGFADKDPEILERYVGDYAFNLASGSGSFDVRDVTEIAEGATGFMLIRRETFERFSEAYPHLENTPDHPRNKPFNGERNIMTFFDTVIDDKFQNITKELNTFLKEKNNTKDDILDFIKDKTKSIIDDNYTNRYLSEDYMFCHFARKAGMQVWLAPFIELKHTGTYTFGGSLRDLAAIGANPTMEKKKK